LLPQFLLFDPRGKKERGERDEKGYVSWWRNRGILVDPFVWYIRGCV